MFVICLITDLFYYTKHLVGHEPKAPGYKDQSMPQVRLNFEGSTLVPYGLVKPPSPMKVRKSFKREFTLSTNNININIVL